MADVTVRGFTPSENVEARKALTGGADFTVAAAADGTVAFTGLLPNREYYAVGLTSAVTVHFTTSENPYRQVRSVVVSVDLASIAANTTVAVNVSTPAGSVDVGDIVVLRGVDSLDNGLVIQSTGPIATADTIPIRVSNLTAGAIDAAAHNFRFAVFKL